jgi:hypothetical protein
MSAALRKVLFWLVMLALPLHGIAGATMMPLHWPGHGAVQMQDGPAHGQAPGTHANGMSKQSMQDSADLMMDCAHGHLKGSMKCSLSAPCGLVAAPALHLPAFLGETGTSTPVVLPSHERIAFCTGAPERPPRFPA